MPKTVMLCDDEPHILRAAEFKIARAGYRVRTAADGEEAWQAIQEESPDILITDCQMPRLDGFGLIERLRHHAPTAALPVYMLTAKGFEIAEAAVERWGLRGIMPKPFSPRQLLELVEGTIGPPEASLEAAAMGADA